ncbi:uncharacterized protein BO97DRAFT_186587 [Aspergillus homomorphus CBS 101889]|uniref:Uncharacterized protein n=1 Tax=Aspergillus homomorphus (strain CBS 101889) TaxID=1450537 RepID=A0A395HP36_ASPHC|nr:hypothetical protein BO97DRAFT_186587 [Aspergillus homomorphus CBS 101889]RAL09193.1 hypothetical protein BO97DRAFT_186587 [Aspergillus homomorphus CBS 101889]
MALPIDKTSWYIIPPVTPGLGLFLFFILSLTRWGVQSFILFLLCTCSTVSQASPVFLFPTLLLLLASLRLSCLWQSPTFLPSALQRTIDIGAISRYSHSLTGGLRFIVLSALR